MDESRKRHLLSLPLLVLAGIAEALCPHCTEDPKFRIWRTPIHSESPRPLMLGTGALANLAVTCKDLYAIVNPILYHQLQGPSAGRLSLLRTLAKRPELARRVKVLRLDFDTGIEEIENEEDRTFARTLAGRLGWSIAFPTAVDRENGLGSYRRERMDDDFITSMIIAMCPNVENLSTICDEFDDLDLPRPATLQHLKDFYLTHDNTEMGTGLQWIKRLFLAAPNIETITSHMTCSVGTDTLPLSNVRHLRLEWSSISSGCLRTLLRSCPQLESFAYEAGGALIGDEQFNTQNLRTLLLRYVPRLKHLEVDFEQDCGMSEGDEGDEGDDDGSDPEPAPGFSSLAHLETLTVDPAVFNDWDEQQSVASLFPQSLRCLTLLPASSDTGPGNDEFEAFATIARNFFPNLTAFKIQNTWQSPPIELPLGGDERA